MCIQLALLPPEDFKKGNYVLEPASRTKVTRSNEERQKKHTGTVITCAEVWWSSETQCAGNYQWYMPEAGRVEKYQPQWMRCVRGCVVFRRPHRANDRHSLEADTTVLRRLDAAHPTALITVEDAAFIPDIFESVKNGDDKSEDVAAWVVEGDGTFREEGETMAYIGMYALVAVEPTS